MGQVAQIPLPDPGAGHLGVFQLTQITAFLLQLNLYMTLVITSCIADSYS